jgi:hypothetical protein
MDPWDEVLCIESSLYEEGLQAGKLASVGDHEIYQNGNKSGYQYSYLIGLELGYIEWILETIDKNGNLITIQNDNHEIDDDYSYDSSYHSTYHKYNDNKNKNNDNNDNFNLDRNDLLHTKSMDNCYIQDDIIIDCIKDNSSDYDKKSNHHAHNHHYHEQQQQQQLSNDIFSDDSSVNIRMHQYDQTICNNNKFSTNINIRTGSSDGSSSSSSTCSGTSYKRTTHRLLKRRIETLQRCYNVPLNNSKDFDFIVKIDRLILLVIIIVVVVVAVVIIIIVIVVVEIVGKVVVVVVVVIIVAVALY